MEQDIINIEIESGKYSVVIRSGDVSNVKVISPIFAPISCCFKQDEKGVYNLKINDNGYNFCIDKEEIECKFSLNPISKRIKVIIPEDCITNLNVVLQNGKFLLMDLILDSAKINSVKGSIIIKDSYCEVANIHGTMGKIKFVRFNGVDTSIRSSVGRVDIVDSDFDKLICATEFGDIRVVSIDNQLINTQVYINDRETLFQNNTSGKTMEKKYEFISKYGIFKSNIF